MPVPDSVEGERYLAYLIHMRLILSRRRDKSTYWDQFKIFFMTQMARDTLPI